MTRSCTDVSDTRFDLLRLVHDGLLGARESSRHCSQTPEALKALLVAKRIARCSGVSSDLTALLFARWLARFSGVNSPRTALVRAACCACRSFFCSGFSVVRICEILPPFSLIISC